MRGTRGRNRKQRLVHRDARQGSAAFNSPRQGLEKPSRSADLDSILFWKEIMVLPTALHLVATAVSATALGTAGSAIPLDAAAPATVVTASGSASPSVAEVGDCVGFALEVTGTEDGVAIEPITAALTGPYDGWPPVGSVADAATVGSFSATWTGSEWSYDGDCLSVSTAGGYAWTLDNPNDPEGLDLTIHDSSIVDITEPVVIDPGAGEEPDSPDDDLPEDSITDIDVVADRPGSDVDAKQPRLAATGANENLLFAGTAGGLLAVASGAALTIRNRRRRVRSEDAA